MYVFFMTDGHLYSAYSRLQQMYCWLVCFLTSTRIKVYVGSLTSTHATVYGGSLTSTHATVYVGSLTAVHVTVVLVP